MIKGEDFFNLMGNIASEETLVRIMIYEIRERNPKAVGFVPTTQDVKSILFHLKTKRYSTIMYLYGTEFLLEILNMCEENENFEDCAEIVKQIKKHNEQLNDNVPTKNK
jgi:hypothetical protein